jgi:hypothetical protein
VESSFGRVSVSAAAPPSPTPLAEPTPPPSPAAAACCPPSPEPPASNVTRNDSPGVGKWSRQLVHAESRMDSSASTPRPARISSASSKGVKSENHG